MEPTEPAAGDAPESPRSRWWFSPMLQVVAGSAVVALQAGPIGSGSANWLNWLVAAAGLAVLGYGAWSWFRARPRA
jgi:hypothetical protein